MDRKTQLSNVAFGGDWSDMILRRERVLAALDLLRSSAERCVEEDVRTPELRAMLDGFVARLSRGAILAEAFWKAAGHPDPAIRQSELVRVLRTVESVVGEEIGRESA